MKISVLCEGLTEQYFVQTVLSPFLGSAVDIDAINLKGAVQLRRTRKSLGVIENVYGEIDKEKPADLVTTMIDLYEIKGWSVTTTKTTKPIDKVHMIERMAAIKAKDKYPAIGDKFVPYIQLHEFEALLFVDFDILGERIGEQASKDLAHELREKQPEEVNESKLTAPSKRIIRFDPQYEFSKTSVGPSVARKIGIPRLRQACPHFNEWITELETRIAHFNRSR